MLIIIQNIIFCRCRISICIIISIARLMDVPRRQIQAHVHIIFRTCCGDLRQDISISLLIVRTRYIISGIIARPDTEAVVMLCRHDQFLKSCFLQCLYQRFRIEVIRQPKDIRRRPVSIAFSPFDFIKGIRSKMTERRQFLLLIPVLVRAGKRSPCFRRCSIIFRQLSRAHFCCLNCHSARKRSRQKRNSRQPRKCLFNFLVHKFLLFFCVFLHLIFILASFTKLCNFLFIN